MAMPPQIQIASMADVEALSKELREHLLDTAQYLDIAARNLRGAVIFNLEREGVYGSGGMFGGSLAKGHANKLVKPMLRLAHLLEDGAMMTKYLPRAYQEHYLIPKAEAKRQLASSASGQKLKD
jgi:hypothetical protein